MKALYITWGYLVFFVGSSRQSLRRFDINLRNRRISSWWWTGPDLSQRNQIPTEVNDKVQAEFLRRSLRCLLTRSYFCKASKKRHCLKCFFVKWPTCLGWKSQKLLIASPKNCMFPRLFPVQPKSTPLGDWNNIISCIPLVRNERNIFSTAACSFTSLSGVDKYIKMKHWTSKIL